MIFLSDPYTRQGQDARLGEGEAGGTRLVFPLCSLFVMCGFWSRGILNEPPLVISHIGKHIKQIIQCDDYLQSKVPV